MTSHNQSSTRICRRCVMDTSDPEIVFDDSGICNHCRSAEALLRRSWFPDDNGRTKLEGIASEIRRTSKGREYDCIVGVSGGVDSSYVLHVAAAIMGLRPLALHVDTGWNSEIAVRNIEQLVTTLDIDLSTYVVDWAEMQDLQLAFLRSSVANQDVPQDHAIFAKIYATAVEHNIRYVITGTNISSESILPKAWGHEPMDTRHLLAIHRQFGRRPLKTFPTVSLVDYHFRWPVIKGIVKVRPLNYLPYDRARAMDVLSSTYGWRDYGGKHWESHWTRFFQSYYLPTKFGYDKRRAHYSSLIVAGQLDRKTALAELDEPMFTEREIGIEKDYVARKLGISGNALDDLIKLPNRSYRDYPNTERILEIVETMKRFAQPLKRQLRRVPSH